MKKAIITDATLRKGACGQTKHSFREKTETAKLLDALGADIIEVGAINDKADVLFLHTISPVIVNSTISCSAGLTEAEADTAYEALSACRSKRLYIPVPASTVQMEYIGGKKSAAMLEIVDTMTKKCAAMDCEQELVLIDATRSEKDFLYTAINTAVKNGTKFITVCDDAGDMLPDEMQSFVEDVIANTDIDGSVSLFVECSEKLGLGTALSVAAIKGGASGIKAGFGASITDFEKLARVISSAGDRLGFCTGVNMTAVGDTAEKIRGILGASRTAGSLISRSGVVIEDGAQLSKESSVADIESAVKKLGYDISEQDVAHVYDEFRKVAENKAVSLHELDAIVAAAAIQVPSTYKLKSYVINSGNVINATANIELTKADKTISGISTGDGPVDAAFRAIEQIIGHHYDVDDFQIQSLTEGREAVGSSIVKLRSESGKLYSGKGVSTDIIGAAIKAYISALNKIYHEEM